MNPTAVPKFASFPGMPMPLSHAVVRIGQGCAQVVQLDAQLVQVSRVQAQPHDAQPEGGGSAAEQAFFGEVCDELTGIVQVMVAGSQAALDDFRRYLARHRSTIALQVVGWEVLEHPTEDQLVAFAREYFDLRGRTQGTPPR